MTKSLSLLFLIVVVFNCQAQDKRQTILGKIKNDSIMVEGVHILNKNTKKGTVSNQYGQFKIPVKDKDTLVFYGIQFQKKEVIITKKTLKKKRISVVLIQQITELSEVEISNHNLTGVLANDAKQVKKPASHLAKGALDFSNVNMSAINNIDAIDRQKPPNPYGGDTSLKFQGGIDIFLLVGLILNPVAKGLSKIGAHKRKLKHAKQQFEQLTLTAPQKIRNELGDTFFMNQLDIPRDQIDDFLVFCNKKGVGKLYFNSKKIEMIEVLIKESQAFKTYVKSLK